MGISSYADLLHAARAQPEPQRLLFVFANAVLPEDATPEQLARFHAGQGGGLEPLVSVDKVPAELGSFAALVEESRAFGDWAIVFVASLGGSAGRGPSSEAAGFALQRMIDAIKTGSVGAFLAFDRQGDPVLFDGLDAA